MKHYPEGFKIALVEKYFLRPNQCIRKLASFRCRKLVYESNKSVTGDPENEI